MPSAVQVFLMWYSVGLLGMCLIAWYRFRVLGLSITLKTIIMVLIGSWGGPIVFVFMVIYFLTEMDWDRTLVRGRNGRGKNNW